MMNPSQHCGEKESRIGHHLLFCGVVVFWFFCSAVFAQDPPPAEAETTGVANLPDKGMRGLADFGKMLRRCYIFDYSSAMFQNAVNLSQNIQNQELRLLISSEAAIYFYQTNNTAAAGPLMGYIQSSLEWARNPEGVCLAHMALARRFMAEKNWAIFGAEIQQAAAYAAQANAPARLGDCNLIRAEGLLAQEKTAEAAAAARDALANYTQTGDILAQSEAHNFLARCLQSAGDAGAAQKESRAAIALSNDTAQAPLLDPEKILQMVPQLMQDHVVAAHNGQYLKAMNDVLSLLILKKYQSRLQSRAEAVKSLGLRESELLAYLACYVLEQGQPLVGQVLLSISDSLAQKELNPVSRGRQRWLSGRFWRRAGYPLKALDLLKKADQLVTDDAEPDFRVGIREEQALSMLRLGMREEADKAIQQALAEAQKANLSQDTARLQGYVASIAAGKMEVESAATPAPAETKPPESPRARFAKTGPAVFQSPFAADYPDGAKRSAAAEILNMIYERLNPTPTPLDLNPELLMRSQLYDQAALKLQKIIREQGESAGRLMQLGNCYFQLHQWENAKKAFERVLQLDPKSGPAQEYLKSVNRQIENKPLLPPKR